MTRQPRPTTCSLPGCDDPHYSRELCQRHEAKERRLRRHRGLLDPVPADRVVKHLGRLRRRGHTWPEIAAAGRTSQGFLHRLCDGTQPTLHREKATRLLAIRPTWCDSTVAVPYTGTGRRLDALAWHGWSGSEVARQLDLSVYVFTNAAYTGRLFARTAAAVARFYDSHADQPGPNPAYAKKARTLGAIPAAAWHGIDIDDPAARPHGMRTTRRGTARAASPAGRARSARPTDQPTPDRRPA